RAFLRVGLAGFGSLSLPGLLRLRAGAPAAERPPADSVILVWPRRGAGALPLRPDDGAGPARLRAPAAPREARPPLHAAALHGAHRRRAPGGIAAAPQRGS